MKTLEIILTEPISISSLGLLHGHRFGEQYKEIYDNNKVMEILITMYLSDQYAH